MGRISPTPDEVSQPQVLHDLVHEKEGHFYVFIFNDTEPNLIFRALGRFAAHPGFNFSWYDAAELSTRARRLRQVAL